MGGGGRPGLPGLRQFSKLGAHNNSQKGPTKPLLSIGKTDEEAKEWRLKAVFLSVFLEMGGIDKQREREKWVECR